MRKHRQIVCSSLRYTMKFCRFGRFLLILVIIENSISTIREKKLMNLFTVVRFQNSECVSSSKNGTCYTAQECELKGGTNGGSCANGFGVCCIITKGCGTITSENGTYLENPSNFRSGTCKYTICKCSNDICQLRLVFDSFMINGPSTNSDLVTKLHQGSPIPHETFSSALSVSATTQCLTDRFSVTSPGSYAPPTICGTNSGQHMYVDASSDCNEVVFRLGSSGSGTTFDVNRRWSIRVTQIRCTDSFRAPDGCTQYYFGSNTGNVQTYNFDGGIHLANQNQNICVRKERGYCKICWTTSLDNDFQISGTASSLIPHVSQSICCGYGRSGVSSNAFDCVTIPGAKTKNENKAAPSRICGRSKGLVTTLALSSSAVAATVCSRRSPFNIRFISDNYEVTGKGSESTATDKGFKLSYILSNEGC